MLLGAYLVSLVLRLLLFLSLLGPLLVLDGEFEAGPEDVRLQAELQRQPFHPCQARMPVALGHSCHGPELRLGPGRGDPAPGGLLPVGTTQGTDELLVQEPLRRLQGRSRRQPELAGQVLQEHGVGRGGPAVADIQLGREELPEVARGEIAHLQAHLGRALGLLESQLRGDGGQDPLVGGEHREPAKVADPGRMVLVLRPGQGLPHIALGIRLPVPFPEQEAGNATLGRLAHAQVALGPGLQELGPARAQDQLARLQAEGHCEVPQPREEPLPVPGIPGRRSAFLSFPDQGPLREHQLRGEEVAGDGGQPPGARGAEELLEEAVPGPGVRTDVERHGQLLPPARRWDVRKGSEDRIHARPQPGVGLGETLVGLHLRARQGLHRHIRHRQEGTAAAPEGVLVLSIHLRQAGTVRAVSEALRQIALGDQLRHGVRGGAFRPRREPGQGQHRQLGQGLRAAGHLHPVGRAHQVAEEGIGEVYEGLARLVRAHQAPGVAELGQAAQGARGILGGAEEGLGDPAGVGHQMVIPVGRVERPHRVVGGAQQRAGDVAQLHAAGGDRLVSGLDLLPEFGQVPCQERGVLRMEEHAHGRPLAEEGIRADQGDIAHGQPAEGPGQAGFPQGQLPLQPRADPVVRAPGGHQIAELPAPVVQQALQPEEVPEGAAAQVEALLRHPHGHGLHHGLAAIEGGKLDRRRHDGLGQRLVRGLIASARLQGRVPLHGQAYGFRAQEQAHQVVGTVAPPPAPVAQVLGIQPQAPAEHGGQVGLRSRLVVVP